MASKSKNCTTNMPPEFKAVYATFRLGLENTVAGTAAAAKIDP
jgi:hypothetical protein